MGQPGIDLLVKELPKIKQEYSPNVIIAQAENVTNGKGCSLDDFIKLKKIGIDFFTGGNWSLWDKSIIPALSDPNQSIIRPANYPVDTPGKGYKYLSTPFGQILVVSLLGQIVGRFSNDQLLNPLKTIDDILNIEKSHPKVAIVVNFHGDYSSEKVVIGQYLDGKVSAVIGDHWHVPTSDSRILPQGTAHISDVGMVGSLNSSLGVKTDIIINRWRDGSKSPNELEMNSPFQINALLFDVNTQTRLATKIQQINKHYY